MSSLQRITLPHRAIQLFERIKYKKDCKKIESSKFLNKPTLIACKRKKFNHHLGQSYNNMNPEMLASGAWKHRKSTGDYFTILPHTRNPSLHASVSSFEEYNLDSKLILSLEAIGIKEPTHIQNLTIPVLMEGKSVLCAAETGSGKTLAYMLPIFQKILKRKMILTTNDNRQISKNYESSSNHVLNHSAINSIQPKSVELNQPSAIIILPSRELAQQIYEIGKQLGKLTDVVVDLKIGGNRTQKLLNERKSKKLDVLITTPNIFSKLLSNRLYNLGNLIMIVLDEADTLLDDSFEEVIYRVINKLKLSYEKMFEQDVQLCLVGATMPTSLQSKLTQIIPFDSLEILRTQSLHRLMPHISHKFIRISSRNKPEHLIMLLKSLKSTSVVIIFCNKPKTVCFLAYTLSANSLPNIMLHADMPQKVRDGRFKEFQNQSSRILISTDVASRGLDTKHADHVINFEFPHFMSDYVHRVGRIGRVGSPLHCHAISYISKPWNVELLWKIETAARKDAELHNVNANIKRKINHIKSQSELRKQQQRGNVDNSWIKQATTR